MATAKSVAGKVSKLPRAIDRIQQDHRLLAVCVATWKKFSDDRAGNLAALVAYYAFASVFPLLLVAYTILDLLARRNPSLADRLSSALKDYPVVGDIKISRSLPGTGIALFIGILVTLYAARGVANAIQNAMNAVWAVPRYQRPTFAKRLVRSLGLLAVLGPGEIITIALSTIAGGAGHLGGIGAKAAAVVVSLLLNIGLFWLGFRIATAKEVRTRELRVGAILAAVAWQILQLAGGLLITQTARNSAYGAFGVVLGLLAWFYVQAQITLYVVELDVVRARRLWPRSLAPPPLTDADLHAYRTYAQATALRPDLTITVDQVPQRDEPATADESAHPATADESAHPATADGSAHPATAVRSAHPASAVDAADVAAPRRQDRPTA